MNPISVSKSELVVYLRDAGVRDFDLATAMQGVPMLIHIGTGYDRLITLHRKFNIDDPQFWIYDVETLTHDELIQKFGHLNITKHGIRSAVLLDDQWYEVSKFDDNLYTAYEIDEGDV